jgi:hypothetical protein
MKIASQLIAAVAAVASAVIATRACIGAEELNRETIYVTTLNTRISTCTTLSEFHKGLGSAPGPITDLKKPVSAPSERSDRAASLARALTLCLADFSTVAKLRQCVADANGKDEHKVHDVVTPGTNSLPPKGGNILVC